MVRPRSRVAGSILATALLLSACGLPIGPSKDPGPEGKEIPEGPGLFSGQDGNLLSYSDEEGADYPGKDERRRSAGPRNLSSAQRAELYREFRDYQRFLEWRDQAKGTEAYREFQDWREWRAYRDWEGDQ